MKKICEFCNKEFESNNTRQKYCSSHILKCPICGNDYEIFGRNFKKTCSSKCSKKLMAKTQEERYGKGGTMNIVRQRMKDKYGTANPHQIPEFREKFENTMETKYGTKSALQSKQIMNKMQDKLENKYGSRNVMQISKFKEHLFENNLERFGTISPLGNKEIQEHIKQTNLDRYGCESPLGNKEVRDKIKNTLLEKYGVDHNFKIEEVKNKREQTWLEHYGTKHPLKSEKILSKIRNTNNKKYGGMFLKSQIIKDKSIKTNLERYGVPYNCMTEQCKEAQGNIISKVNLKFSKLLTENNIKHELEFNINAKAYDFHILDTNLLIEINPTVTHNVNWIPFGRNPVDKYYHYNKSKLAEENGYHCFHIFDWFDTDRILYFINNYNEFKFIVEKEYIRSHWYNRYTKEHLLDNNFNEEEMVSNGFVQIYDDGLILKESGDNNEN